MPLRTSLWTLLALVAFAANSILCRLALSGGGMDPAAFTTIRLLAGAVTLALLLRSRNPSTATIRTSWTDAALLFLYATFFSFAYRLLQAGTGALLLFGAVQVTMLIGGFRDGHRHTLSQGLGLALAFGGLTYLVLPGLASPSPLGAGLMIVAGLSWGLYSLSGRMATDPLAQTASNFARTIPMVILLCLVSLSSLTVEPRGVLLASLSGAGASGLGYVLWYRALPGLSPITAAIVQLAVPVLAAGGGIAFLDEQISWRLGVATLLVLGGIAIAVISVRRPQVA